MPSVRSKWGALQTPSAERTIEAEGELFDIIHTAVDKHLGPAFAGGIENMTREQIVVIEQQAIRDIWSEWEGNE